ncbi:MAG: hypothetical protein GY866_24185 [Proteobacteria bacterium]|nr:hypothetical protein [Pseudomonadota bacterium]
MIEREIERKIEDFRELGLPQTVPRTDRFLGRWKTLSTSTCVGIFIGSTTI